MGPLRPAGHLLPPPPLPHRPPSLPSSRTLPLLPLPPSPPTPALPPPTSPSSPSLVPSWPLLPWLKSSLSLHGQCKPSTLWALVHTLQFAISTCNPARKRCIESGTLLRPSRLLFRKSRARVFYHSQPLPLRGPSSLMAP